MLKIVLIGLVCVHATLQIELAPDFELHPPKHVEGKKHFNKEHKKNKEQWKGYNEERIKKRYDDDFEKHYDGEVKHKGGKPKKHYKEEKNKYARSVANIEGPVDIVQSTPGRSLADDVNVNFIASKQPEPNSEIVRPTKKNFFQELVKVDLSSVPDPNNTALMARYIVHNTDWCALATVTSRFTGKYYPFANLVSTSDGPVDTSSGVPFFYLSPLDLSTQDLISDNKASIMMSLAQTDYCRSKTLDAEDPRCARIIISGKIKRVKSGTVEEEFASNALFSRHPAMKTWPKDHEFYFAKMKIGQIIVLDKFGGASHVDVEQYLHLNEKKLP